ncbi:hypothetical protein Golomagni_00345 [Golovinomyces magnicellulatus]|nr:hypothetical protein Golomagni_00345 [Golovinomyces magnicellulatus]
MALKVAVLTISATAFKGDSIDSSTEALKDVFRDQITQTWEVVSTKIVGDDIFDIQRAITNWTDKDSPPNLIVTTGGTGFAVHDITPEAVTPLLDKSAPGLVHGMLTASYSITPFALMSRPVAGIRKNSVILTLPGSPKGATENLESILKLLSHACLQTAGADSRTLHAGGVGMLELEAGFILSNGKFNSCTHSFIQESCDPRETNHTSHSGDHLSNNQGLGPTFRHRKSPYPMISVSEALRLIHENLLNPRVIRVVVNADLVGYVLAKDIISKEAVPAYRASIVDGYAVVVPCSSSIHGVFPVASVSSFSNDQVHDINSDEIARVTTGAPIPPSANAVVMVEKTVLESVTKDRNEEKTVRILEHRLKPGDNVREIGSDIQIGDTILRKGEKISATGGELGLLASVGILHVNVFQRPIIGVLSTGDEIVEYNRSENIRRGEVRDSNKISIIAAARSRGFRVIDLGIAKDNPGELEQKLKHGLRQVDVIITSGGVSMGEHDLLKHTIERVLHGTIHFGRVSMKPGKPTTFASVPFTDDAGKMTKRLIFCLPGNPVSSQVTFLIFVLPLLEYSSGITSPGLPKVSVILGDSVRLDPERIELHRAVITFRQDGFLYATSTGSQQSSKIGSLREANGLLILPAGSGTLSKGVRVDALLIDRLNSLLNN